MGRNLKISSVYPRKYKPIGGFHENGYHALMEISRYNYKMTHFYVYIFPCVYVVVRR